MKLHNEEPNDLYPPLNTGALLYRTSIVCHFPSLIRRACWLSAESGTLIQSAS